MSLIRAYFLIVVVLLIPAAIPLTVYGQRNPDLPAHPVVRNNKRAPSSTSPGHASSANRGNRKSQPAGESTASTSNSPAPPPTLSIAGQVEQALEEGNKARVAKQYEQATAHYQRALSLDAKEARAYNGLGNISLDKENYADAITAYKKTIELNPILIYPYINLGNSYSQLKRYDEAIAQYKKAIVLNPKYVIGYYNLGITYNKLKRYDEAIAQYKKTIEIDPNHASAYNNLAWFFATALRQDLRNGKLAIEYAQKACELTKWQEPNFLDTLAAAFAETGDFPKAIQWQKKALEFAGFANVETRQRLELYTKGQPYREP
jgi:tetratricopeptide (TPR) repeat protein